jgi:hypothetical protein
MRQDALPGNTGPSSAEVRIAATRERFKESKHAASHGGSEKNLMGSEGGLDNPVIRALWEVVDQLDAHRVDYALMGGLAVRAHAIPRPTNDVDLTITCPREQFAKLLTCFESECIQVPEIYKSGWLDRVAEMPLVKLKTMLDQDHWVDLDIFLCETDFQRSLMDRRSG